jgi:hypothetical protein
MKRHRLRRLFAGQDEDFLLLFVILLVAQEHRASSSFVASLVSLMPSIQSR